MTTSKQNTAVEITPADSGIAAARQQAQKIREAARKLPRDSINRKYKPPTKSPRRSALTRATATEGPSHDPYGVETFNLTRQNGASAFIHQGLAQFVEVKLRRGRKTHKLDTYTDEQRALADALLVRAVGLTAAQIERAYRKQGAARLRPHRKHGAWHEREGFPGESFLVCACGVIIDSSFDIRAVE